MSDVSPVTNARALNPAPEGDAAGSATPGRLALVIGCNGSQTYGRQLADADADATAMATALTAAGWELDHAGHPHRAGYWLAAARTGRRGGVRCRQRRAQPARPPDMPSGWRRALMTTIRASRSSGSSGIRSTARTAGCRPACPARSEALPCSAQAGSGPVRTRVVQRAARASCPPTAGAIKFMSMMAMTQARPGSQSGPPHT
jgi:hypothetical protein